MKRYFAIMAVLFAMLPLAAQAQLYGVSLNGFANGDPGPSSLYVIDPATGAGTLIGDMGYAVNSIAVDPTTGIMYASTTTWSGDFNGLLQVDPNTGAATEIGEFGVEFEAILALTFDSSGQLWGWHDPSDDDPVTIDKTTGAATTVGESGLSTAGHVMAFNPADVLYLVQGTSVYIIDQVTGAANSQGSLGFDPGAGGAAFDSTGTLWASRETGQTQDSWIRLTDIDGNSFADIDTDVEYLNALTAGDVSATLGTARFRVTKTFSDGRDDEVNVHLSCNSGLPLEQDFTISGGGDGVLFVVTELQGTETVCEVTESGGPDGYTTVYNGGAGCTWEGVTGGLRTCAITNEANPAEFTVTKDWVIEGAVGEEVLLEAQVTIDCSSDILTVDGFAVPVPDGSVTAFLSGDGDSVTVTVDTTLGSTSCSARESIFQTGVESTDNCGSRSIAAGGSSSCTITNTVFFESIPTLSQYGMALMALLMLGLGFVGLRRFV